MKIAFEFVDKYGRSLASSSNHVWKFWSWGQKLSMNARRFESALWNDVYSESAFWNAVYSKISMDATAFCSNHVWYMLTLASKVKKKSHPEYIHSRMSGYCSALLNVSLVEFVDCMLFFTRVLLIFLSRKLKIRTTQHLDVGIWRFPESLPLCHSKRSDHWGGEVTSQGSATVSPPPPLKLDWTRFHSLQFCGGILLLKKCS